METRAMRRITFAANVAKLPELVKRSPEGVSGDLILPGSLTLSLGRPFLPMRRRDMDPMTRPSSLDPKAADAAAREHGLAYPVGIDHGYPEIAICRNLFDGFDYVPHAAG